MKKIPFKDFAINEKMDFGAITLTEQEIIDFATRFDPLDFHINKEAAKKSFFKDLIASGPHIFNLFHRTEWIPRYGDTVVCGLEVNHWKFIKPIYAKQRTFCFVTILSIIPNPEKKVAAVKWLYEFKDDKGEMVQSLDMLVLHKMEG